MATTPNRFDEIKRRYHDPNDTLGYDDALAACEAFGMSEGDADKFLVPIKPKANVKATLQGLERDDLALLLHGLNTIHVADMVKRQAKLTSKIKAALMQNYGVSDVAGKG